MWNTEEITAGYYIIKFMLIQNLAASHPLKAQDM